jgi:hypothetical protein
MGMGDGDEGSKKYTKPWKVSTKDEKLPARHNNGQKMRGRWATIPIDKLTPTASLTREKIRRTKRVNKKRCSAEKLR